MEAMVVLDQGLVVHTLVLQDLGNFNLHNSLVISYYIEHTLLLRKSTSKTT